VKYNTENTVSSNQGEYLNDIISLLAEVEKVNTDIYGQNQLMTMIRSINFEATLKNLPTAIEIDY